MIQIELEIAECQQVLNILAGTRDFPWSVTNPLLMKIGEQMRVQTMQRDPPPRERGNSVEEEPFHRQRS